MDNTYGYDANANRIQKHTLPGLTRYSYDAEGLRAELEENGRLVSFIFNDDKVVTEKSDNNTVCYVKPLVQKCPKLLI